MLRARLLRSEEDLKKVTCDLKSIPDGYFWQLLLEHIMEKNFLDCEPYSVTNNDTAVRLSLEH